MITKSRSKRLKNQEMEVEKKEENMKTIAIVSLLCLGMFLAMGTGVVFAAHSDTETSVVQLVVPASCKLDIVNADVKETLLEGNAATVTAFESGFIVLATTPELLARANKGWTLSASSTAWVVTNGGWALKPISDLSFAVSGTGSGKVAGHTHFDAIATSYSIAAGTVGIKGVTGEFLITYTVLLDYLNDIPGTYTATVTYTLATAA